MATNALIVVGFDVDSFYTNNVNFDGYIDGVGKILFENWNDLEAIRDLCKDNRMIRQLGIDKEHTEFYPVPKTAFAIKMRDRERAVSWDQVLNLTGNYDYTYFWDGVKWLV